MGVRIKFFTTLRKAAGIDGLELEPTTVGKAVKQLLKRFNDNSEFARQLKMSNAILNGTNVTYLKGASTKLSDGDELVFFPPVGGG